MKRIDKLERMKLKRYASLLPKARLRRRKRLDGPLKSKISPSRVVVGRVKPLQKIEFPKEFGLFDPAMRESLLTAIARMKWAVANPHVKDVVIDLSAVMLLHSCGTLLFIAEVDRLMEIDDCYRKIHVVESSDDTVCQMFQYIGFYSRFGIESRFHTIDNRDVIDWVYGIGEQNNLGTVVDRLPTYLTGARNKSLRMAVTGGMTEAVANSAEHAYIASREDGVDLPTPKRWWMFSRKFEDHMLVVICDLGIGIPRTLNMTWHEDLSSFLKTMTGKKREDHQLIKFALTVGKTRTNLKHRGKGLKDILKVVQQQKVGLLRIYSNKGVYYADGSSGRIEASSSGQSIFGTLVQWVIPIAAFENVAGG